MRITPVTALFFTLFCEFGLKFISGTAERDDSELNSIEIIEKYGYPAETHVVETEDGYLLQLQRIPHGKNLNNSRPGIPLLLLHGLFASSSEFLLLGPISLPFLAADKGYDVWLGNFRGNEYGMIHRNLSPESTEFWNFSWHENGIYDLPAQIDYICNYTKHDRILILGHSMGATTIFVMASLRQDYQKKIQGAVMLGPIVTFKGIKQSAIIFLAPLANFMKGLSDFLSHGKILNNSRFSKQAMKFSCGLFPKTWHVCRNIVFFGTGTDPIEFNEERLNVLMGHIPSSTSMKSVTHYLQVVKSGKFQQYDYGRFKNYVKYRSYEPPEYNLQLVNFPISFIMAQNDVFMGKEDIDFLRNRLPNIRSIDYVDYFGFTHADFIIARHADTLVYNKVFERFENILISS